jgi:CRP/FNR family cyclic AMP-dependent transcriptional regulator
MKTRDLSEILADHPLLADLGPDRASVLAGCAKIVRFDAGARIISVDDPADQFWLIRHGHVNVELHAASHGTLVISTLQRDDLLGVSWIAPPYVSRFDATARDTVTAVEFDAACLRGKCDEDPVLGYALFNRFAALMGDRLQATRLQFLDMYGDPS